MKAILTYIVLLIVILLAYIHTYRDAMSLEEDAIEDRKSIIANQKQILKNDSIMIEVLKKGVVNYKKELE